MTAHAPPPIAPESHRQPTLARTMGLFALVVYGVGDMLGAGVYATKTPNPRPRWIGFPEIFHVLTVVGFACHSVAIFLAATAS